MDLMSLVATLTLDKSEYIAGLEEAKRQAQEFSKAVQDGLDQAAGGGSGGQNPGGSPPDDDDDGPDVGGGSTKDQVDPMQKFIEYMVKNKEKIDSTSTLLEQMAHAFNEVAKDSEDGRIKGLGAFVDTIANNSGKLDTTAGKLSTMAEALGNAVLTNDSEAAQGIGTFIVTMAQHSGDLDTTAGKLTSLADAFAKASEKSSNEAVQGLGTFVKTIADNKDNLGTTAGKLETFAKAFAEASEKSSNSHVQSIGTFVGYLVKHKEDLNTTTGKLTTLATAFGQASQKSENTTVQTLGTFVSTLAENSDKFGTTPGALTAMAEAFSKAGGEDNAANLLSNLLLTLAANASLITNPIGLLYTLFSFMLANKGEIKQVFDDTTNSLGQMINKIGELNKLRTEQNQGLVDRAVSTATGLTSEDMAARSQAWQNYEDLWNNNFASGIDYVRENGTRAVLHEGEAVLDKADAEAWRSGGSTMSPAEFGRAAAAAMAEALAGMNVMMDGQTVGRITAETVGRELERSSRAGRFAPVYG